MKIKVEKWLVDGEVSYHIVDISKCCNNILHNQSIYLNYKYNKDDDYDNAIYSLKLIEYASCAYQTINYCPFCGEKIEIKVVNTVDKNKAYQILQQQRELLWEKCCETDSKKEEAKLRSEVEIIDQQINNILDSDNFESYFQNIDS